VDQDAAISRAEIHDHVALVRFGHLQHAADHAVGRRHPRRVLALLAERERRRGVLREGRGGQEGRGDGG
jgi:hypothetical protein